MKLDGDELTVLIEALEAWIHKDASGEMISSLIFGLFGKDDVKMEQKMADMRAESDQKKVLRKDRAILIQAKLIQMRDGLVAESVMPSTAKPAS